MNLDTIVCMDNVNFMHTLPDTSIDMVLTSPPYDNLRKYGGFTWDFEALACELYRVIKPGGVVVWVVADGLDRNKSESLTSFKQALYFKEVVGFRMHQTMVFHDPGTAFPDPTRYTRQHEYMFVMSKGRPQTIKLQTQRNKWAGDHRPEGSIKTQQEPDGTRSIRQRKPVKEFGVLGTVWTLGTGYGKSTKDKIKHPATFPEKLAERHILTWSEPGDIVLDPFMGSGTTAKISRNLGRHFIGCELNQTYIDEALERLAKPWQPALLEG